MCPESNSARRYSRAHLKKSSSEVYWKKNLIQYNIPNASDLYESKIMFVKISFVSPEYWLIVLQKKGQHN